MAEGQYVNDLYDGKLSYKLENGAKKFNYDAYTPDHYDSKKVAPADVKGDSKNYNYF